MVYKYFSPSQSREGLKKIPQGGGSATANFSLKKKRKNAENTGFCLKINLRHAYFFNFLVGDPFQLVSQSEGSLKLYKLSRDG